MMDFHEDQSNRKSLIKNPANLMSLPREPNWSCPPCAFKNFKYTYYYSFSAGPSCDSDPRLLSGPYSNLLGEIAWMGPDSQTYLIRCRVVAIPTCLRFDWRNYVYYEWGEIYSSVSWPGYSFGLSRTPTVIVVKQTNERTTSQSKEPDSSTLQGMLIYHWSSVSFQTRMGIGIMKT